MPIKEATKERNLLQSFLLIVIETLLTFLLKHDRTSKLQAQNLIKQRAVICFKTHLPSDTFFVTFAPQGVLFDFEVSEAAKIGATVTASTPDLLRAFFTAGPQIMGKIRITGDQLLSDELFQLMECFNLPQILSDWRHWLDFRTHDVTPVTQRMKPLMRRIDEQRSQLNNMNIVTKEQAYEIRTLKRNNKILFVVFIMTVIALIASVLFNVWYA